MQNNMYAQPGTAAEAYLRRVADGDRRRLAALTYGDVAGRLEIFGLAVSANSRHYERSETPLSTALADWTPVAVKTCEDFDYEPPFDPEPPTGCERVDVLFAIDGSLSMDGEQDALRGVDGMPPVFAEFTDALLMELTDVEDFHVGVVSSEVGYTQMHTHRDFPATPEGPDSVQRAARPALHRRPLADARRRLRVHRRDRQRGRHGGHRLQPRRGAARPANAGFLRDDSLLFA
jgi:hypothetical protein